MSRLLTYKFPMSFDVLTFYKFIPFANLESLKQDIFARLEAFDVRGTIILASEGINGTLCAPSDGAGQKAAEILRSLVGCADLNIRYSHCETRPFLRLKVRLKNEIVTMGLPEIDPNVSVGDYVDPKDWNALISDSDTVVIDTRNSYEYSVGTFEGAIDPKTKSFREFPEWFRENRVRNPNTKYAMFCTGGIRCEKATSFLKSEGVEEVFHLKGGILSYLEQTPEAESKWQGDCFVFDERVTVKHGLEAGDYKMCHACKHPLSPEDLEEDAYKVGVSCLYCIGNYDAKRLESFEERQKQLRLSRERGEKHMGPDTRLSQISRTEAKLT